jgi:hypothetical protein
VSITNLDLNVILNMPAGPEMDALVAKEVMGYSVDFEEDHGTAGNGKRIWFVVTGKDDQLSRSTIAKYSTDIKAAWQVAKKMQSSGDVLSLEHRNMIDNAPGTAIWTAWFRRTDEFARAGTPSLAVCRAALLAIRNSQQPLRNYVNGNFFSMIENELAKAMGPIAPIILEDKIAEFKESRDSFPEDRTESFVKALGEEITDSSEKASFTRATAEFLRRTRMDSRQLLRKYINGTFFSMIENELAKAMGPIAPIILEEKIAEFGKSRDSFPEDQAEPFVKALGEEIADSSEKASFTRATAEVLRRRRK